MCIMQLNIVYDLKKRLLSIGIFIFVVYSDNMLIMSDYTSFSCRNFILVKKFPDFAL